MWELGGKERKMYSATIKMGLSCWSLVIFFSVIIQPYLRKVVGFLELLKSFFEEKIILFLPNKMSDTALLFQRFTCFYLLMH